MGMRRNPPLRAETRGAQIISRRTVARGAAWTAPIVAVGFAAPAFAISGFVDPVGTCYDRVGFSGVGVTDLHYLGPINTLNNTTHYSSTNGSCSGTAGPSLTMVRAPDQVSANALCSSLTGGVGPIAENQQSIYGANTPPDFWTCG